MLAEAKNLSELMVDLAYGAVYFNSRDMAEEVIELEKEMNDLIHDMREICVLAVRKPREAEGMSSVLQVVSAIERIANDAVDISRIVTADIGIPAELTADLAEAAEISHRVLVSAGSHLANRPVADFELPVATGMRIFAIKRARQWFTSIDGDFVMAPEDVLFLRGSPVGIERLHELAGAAAYQPPKAGQEDSGLTHLDRAIDLLVEMKDLSEAAVWLAYSALVLGKRALAQEVRNIERRLNVMNDRLELWVLSAAKTATSLAPLRGLLQLARAAEDIGDQARQMTWVINEGESIHPILELALGGSDETIAQLCVQPESQVEGKTLAELELNINPGFTIIALRRGQRYFYRLRGSNKLQAGDEVVASGPDEGRDYLALLFGWRLERDEETGEDELHPID